MTERDCICQPTDHKERNEHSASCNRAFRTKQANKLKPPKTKKPIDKVGKNNTFKCSDGGKVTDSGVRAMLAQAYLIRDELFPYVQCEGCKKELATCHAHIIAKAECKRIGKTELIWDINNFFNSCWSCNTAIENPKGNEWKQLKNIDKCLKFIAQHHYELFQKFQANSAVDLLQFKEPHQI